jgi:hypothetical protein
VAFAFDSAAWPTFDVQTWVRQEKLGKGGWNDLKPFDGTQRVIKPHPERQASHPEASLAWRWSDSTLRSVDSECAGRVIEPRN